MSEYRLEVFEIPETPHTFHGHPAKMLPGLADLLVSDYAKVGDEVLDPMCGIGTTLQSCAEQGVSSHGIDIEQKYVDVCMSRGFSAVQGDACDLPFGDSSFDVIITSPPYGEAIGRSGDRAIEKTISAKSKYEEKRFGKTLTPHAVYGTHDKNLGSLPLMRKKDPCFVNVFPSVMSECYRVLKSGGMCVFVVKDQRRGRRRLGMFDLPGFIVSLGSEVGFIFHERRIGIIPSNRYTLWQRVNAERWGRPLPNSEHIIVLMKN